MAEVSSLTLAELRAVDVEVDALAGPGHAASGLKPGVTSPNAVAVAGREGYLFIGDGANRWERQLLSETPPPEAWREAWMRVLAGRQAEAARRGVRLETLIVPEKQVIYPDKRWGPQPPDIGRRPVAGLLPRLGADLRVRYPVLELRAARALGPAFHRHNSHWTPSGCGAVLTALAAHLGAPVDWTTQRFAYRRHSTAQDLTGHLFDPAPAEETGALERVGEVWFDDPQYEKTGRNTGSTYGVRNPRAPDARRVVVFGDSYAFDAGLGAALSAVFAQVVFVWSKAARWDAVEAHGADIVICETAERFMATVPDA